MEPPSDEPNDTELDLEKVEQLLKIGALSKARNISRGFADHTPRLVEALNITAIKAFSGQHLRAAELLWRERIT